MLLEQHYLDCLSQASYVIGDTTTGRAVVVDPRRDIDAYLESAEQHGLSIELIIETHFHADFLSGHLELAAATGAEIAFGERAQTDFASRKLADGERISLGEVQLEILHTPGHTPESISIVVLESPDGPPHAVLTGDTLFIGDVGRPDLLSAAGMTSDELASQLFDSLHEKLLALPDETIIYPGHGAGSSCGKSLSEATSCTIGRQRLNNYALAPMTRQEFIDVVTTGQSAPPAYFAHDAVLNRENRALFNPTPSPVLSIEAVRSASEAGAVIVDTRAAERFNTAHLPGSVNVGLDGRFAEYAGAVLDPARELIVVADSTDAAAEARMRLARVGFDRVIGHLAVHDVAVLDDGPTATVARLDVGQLGEQLAPGEVQLVDVRQPGETERGTVDGAHTIPLTELNERLSELDPNRSTVVYCAGGYRSSIAASVLRRAGFDRVTDLVGGYAAWHAAHAPA